MASMEEAMVGGAAGEGRERMELRRGPAGEDEG